MGKTSSTHKSPSPSYLRGGSVTHLQVINENRLHIVTPRCLNDNNSSGSSDDSSWWPKGLQNVGNTCYANAALQCLLSTSLPSALLNPKSAAVLRRYSSNGNLLAMGSGSVDSDDEDDSSSTRRSKVSRRERRRKEREDRRMHKTCQWLTKELKVITKDYINHGSTQTPHGSLKVLEWLGSSAGLSRRAVVNPGSITRHPDHLSKCLRPYRQEDAHEFLRALLSTLIMNGHNKQLSSLFDGLLESAVTCQTCRRPSLTRDRYMDLSLDIHGDHIDSLVRALEEFTKTELLSGENKVFCQKCKTKRTATKGLRLATAPSILVCHLKRFAFDPYGNLVRLHKKVQFPTQLELGDYMSKVNKSKPPPYELVGVLVHQGRTCDSGHYLAYTKCNGEWFKCNDSEVTRVDAQTVLEQQAYILMYEVEEMRRNHGGLKHRANAVDKAILKDQKNRQATKARQQTTLMSLLCGVEVLEENSFLGDLCCRGPLDSVSGSTAAPESSGVEMVASLRDDATIASTVCDSTVESTTSSYLTGDYSKGSSKQKGSPAFRKSASSGNLQELEDDASKSYVSCEPAEKTGKLPRRRNSARNTSEEERTFTTNASNSETLDYNTLCEAKWNSDRISRHNWKCRDLPPLPTTDPARPKGHRRATSVTPGKQQLL